MQQVYDFAERAHEGQKADTGMSYFQHALATAQLLAELRLDPDAVAAALLHDVIVVADVPLRTVKDSFGEDIEFVTSLDSELWPVIWRAPQ